MISHSEKEKRQRALIDELYENLQNSKPTAESYLDDFFLDRVKKIFIAEMEYYGVKTCQENWKDDEIHFEKKNDPKSRFAAEFCHKTSYGLDGRPYHETPSVKLNVGCDDYKLLFDEDPFCRRIACRYILKELAHEIGHFRQYSLIHSGRTSYYVLLCAMEMITSSKKDEWYNINHDRFSYEADADYYSFRFENSIGKPNLFSVYGIPIKDADTLTGNLIIPGIGFMDRDYFVFAYIDMLLHKSNSAYKIISAMPIFSKVYNFDGSRKRLSELMLNHKNEIKEVEKLEIEEEKKKALINDINGFYFELYNRKIDDDERFEIYEAIHDHSYTAFTIMLSKLKLYNQNIKKLKLDAIKRKSAALKEQDMPNEILNDNNGYIIDPKKDDNSVISAEEFVKSIPLNTTNEKIIQFIHSNEFIKRIPVFGYYLIPSGEKLSIKDFINDYLIPLLPEEGTKKSYNRYLFDIAREFVQPFYNHEEQFNLEKTNRQYQLLDNSIKKCADAIRDNGIGLLAEKYDFTIYKSMELIKNLIDYNNKDILSVFNAKIIQTPHGSYKDFSEEQIELFNSFKLAAQILTTDKYFNPEGINYYNKMYANYYLIELENEIQVCMKFKSTENPSL